MTRRERCSQTIVMGWYISITQVSFFFGTFLEGEGGPQRCVDECYGERPTRTSFAKTEWMFRVESWLR